MSFPSQVKVREPLLVLIYLRGGAGHAMRSEDTYSALADHFDLTTAERAMSRGERYGDGHTSNAWANTVQFARATLVKKQLLHPRGTSPAQGVWALTSKGVEEAAGLASRYAGLGPAAVASIKPPTATVGSATPPSTVPTVTVKHEPSEVATRENVARGRAKNYETGKWGEVQTKAYLTAAGFAKPTPDHRKNIAAALARQDMIVHGSGFDAVRADQTWFLESVDAISKRLDELRLYEVKTCGAARKSNVSPGFKGLGFTLTGKERHNAEVLGSRYRFLFVNLRTETHRECGLTDFFLDGRARIYRTWSVFLTQDLPPEDAEPSAAADGGAI